MASRVLRAPELRAALARAAAFTAAPLRLVDMGSPDAFARACLPGARRSPYRGDLKGPTGLEPLAPADARSLFSALDLRVGQSVVVYDSGEALPAARLAWVLRYYGAPHVAVLDGGFGAYLEEAGGEFATSGGRAAAAAGAPEAADPLLPRERSELLASTQDVLELVGGGRSGGGGGGGGGPQLLDARSPAEFSGEAVHGEGMRPGHIPGALNVPFAECLSADGTRRYLPPEQLRAVLRARGVDLARPAILMCLAGVRASVLHNALLAAGAPLAGLRLYDGSMAAWQQERSLPLELGPK